MLGFGTFGQFLARRWVRRGHLVYAQSRTDYSELARTMGVTYADCAADCAADYSELARTMRTPEELISGLPPPSSADCLPHQRIAPPHQVRAHARGAHRDRARARRGRARGVDPLIRQGAPR